MKTIFILIGCIGWIALIASIYVLKKIKHENNKIKNVNLDRNYNVSKDPKVVVIGGGTGQSIFLSGLKLYTQNITAVVTVADDGGGSGVLREDLGMLPPGDIRNCLIALANIEPTMREVMQYRFKDGNLKGQSFGNLFIAAMNGLYDNFEIAVYKMSEIFAITGRVLPVTLENVNLKAKLKNGNIVKGESKIPLEVRNQKSEIESITLDPTNVEPLQDVIKSIYEADIIVIGPGSLYTSIIPNLLVKDVVKAIKKSTAPKVYISNIMTQPGETDNYNVVDHINAIIKHTNCNLVDYIITNNEILPNDVFEKYRKDGANQVLLNKYQKNQLNNMDIKVIEDNLVEVRKTYIRHDAKHIAKIILDLALSHNNDNDK